MQSRVIIFLLVCLALCAAPASVEGVKSAHAASAKKEEKLDENGNVIHPEFEYMEMRPLTLPIITERGITQQVSLLVSIEMPYGKGEEVEYLKPRLADAYLQDLYGLLGANGSMMQGNVLNVMAIKQRLTDVTHKILGKENFHDVLLQVVQQRPM